MSIYAIEGRFGFTVKKLLIATRNSGKVREFSRMLSQLSIDRVFDVVGLDDLQIDIEVEETGSAFQENAVLKARQYADVSGEVTLADDSGLVVDALNGAPGVLSARYGGDGFNDEDRVNLLLENMHDVPGWERAARFIAVIAVAGPGVPGGLVTSEGVVEGAIMHEPIGHKGFGYDPVFWIPRCAKTTAQMSAAEKDAISHRGVALRGLQDTLKALF